MIKKIFINLLILLSAVVACAQVNRFPVREWISAKEKPLVLYITGDGGNNKFSTDLCTAISKAGYAVSSINAKSYFWNKRTPGQTVTDITAYLTRKLNSRKNKQLIFAGYSFGADVMPFIVNRLQDTIREKIISVILISPSLSTDFEIHWSDMLDGNTPRSMDVVAEINKMTAQKTITLFGSDETDFPIKNINLKNYTNEILPGGHRFDGNTDEVAKKMMKYFK